MQCFCAVYSVKKTLYKFSFILFVNFNLSINIIETSLLNIELSLFVKTLTFGKLSILGHTFMGTLYFKVSNPVQTFGPTFIHTFYKLIF